MPEAIRGNFITNRPDLLTAPVHLAKHLGQSIWQGLKSLCGARPSHTVPPGIRPQGRKPGASDRTLPDLQGAKPIRLSSHESFRDLPMLTPGQARQARKYIVCANLSQYGNKLPLMATARVDDAFQCTHLDRELVPESIRSSTVRKAGPPTQLLDSSTGLAASINVDPANNEVIVGFSGVDIEGPRLGCGLNQMLSCATQWMGLVPKNMRQGSRIVGLMKEHIDALNRDLPEGQQLKLTVTGFSMGGGVASYAALRNEVPAVVFNPMRLGLGARAFVGQNTLAHADRYLTEVVIPGDWLSDNGLSHLYKLNPLTWGGVILDSTGKLGNARRLLLPVAPSITGRARHNGVRKGLEHLIQGAEQRDFLLPSIAGHWDETCTDKERAGLATEPLGELARKLQAEFPDHSRQIDALVETLNRITMPSELSAQLNECGYAQATFNLMQNELRHLMGITQARKLLTQLPETALREALGKDLQRLETALSQRIVDIHEKLLQLSADSLEQFAIDRERRESEASDGSLTGTGPPHSELLELNESLVCLEAANDALKSLDPNVIDGLEDHTQRGAAMLHALQRGFDESAGHLVALAARNAKPEAFAHDLELCQDAEDAHQLTARALSQARTLSRLRHDINRQFPDSPTRPTLDEALGKLQSEWLAKALASTDKGVTHAETLMSELDACIEQLSEQPTDQALRTKLEEIAQRLRDSMIPLNDSLRSLQDDVDVRRTNVFDRLPSRPAQHRARPARA